MSRNLLFSSAQELSEGTQWIPWWNGLWTTLSLFPVQNFNYHIALALHPMSWVVQIFRRMQLCSLSIPWFFWSVAAIKKLAILKIQSGFIFKRKKKLYLIISPRISDQNYLVQWVTDKELDAELLAEFCSRDVFTVQVVLTNWAQHFCC